MKNKTTTILAIAAILCVMGTFGFTKIFKTKALQRAKEQVVRIESAIGRASGVVIGDHLVLTANHIIHDETNFTIKDVHGKSYKAIVFGKNKDKDLALFYIYSGYMNIKPATLEDNYKIGDPIFAIGYCLPEDIEKPIPRIGFGFISNITENCIDMDLGIFELGISGGGAFSTKGKLIGINSKILSLRPTFEPFLGVYSWPSTKVCKASRVSQKDIKDLHDWWSKDESRTH